MNEVSSIKEVNVSKELLLEWSGKKQMQLTLTYRGSRDGFNNQQFHSKVDGKGPANFVCIQSETGLVFGAYTSKPFYTPQQD
jgi:TLD